MHHFVAMTQLKLYFGPHLVEAFTARFDELLSWAQILTMECACNDDAQEVEKQWNAVSNGAMHLSSGPSPMDKFADSLLDRLKGKLVIFERSPYRKTDEDANNSLYNEALNFWNDGDTGKAVRKLGEYYKEFASQAVQRDIKYSRQMKELLTAHPQASILCYRGTSHVETLPILLIEKDLHSIRTCSGNPTFIPSAKR